MKTSHRALLAGHPSPVMLSDSETSLTISPGTRFPRRNSQGFFASLSMTVLVETQPSLTSL